MVGVVVPALLVVSIGYKHAPLVFTQFPAGAASAICGPRLLYPTLVPTLRNPAMPATPTQFAGASTGPPSLPAETTTSTPSASTSLITICSADVQFPVAPRLMLMIRAGCVLSGTPSTWSPAAQRIASRMSESAPPHLPNTRRGRIVAAHVIPAMPVELLVMAPRMPAVRVPCHELFATVQLANFVFDVSLELTQSPGSDASASRPSPSLATAASEMKS